MTALLLALIGGAGAAEPPRQLVALSGTGGFDLASRQGFAGLDVALHHDGAEGFAAVGRVQAAYAARDQRPLFRLEAGFTGVVRAPSLVRVGLVAGTGLLVAPFAAPLQVGGPPAEGDFGRATFFPYAQLVAELGGRRDAERGWAAWGVGLRAGAGATLGTEGCAERPFPTCVAPAVGFSGGLSARVRFHEGAYLEVLAGPTSFGVVGYAF